MITIKSTSIDTFLLRVATQSNGNIWSVIVVNPLDSEEIVNDLQDSISIFADCEVGIISGKEGSDKLIKQIKQASEDYLLLYNIEEWNQGEWRKLDALRSHLDQKKRGGVLILSSESLKNLLTYSPNFASWLGGKIYNLNKGEELITEEERETRLLALQEWSGLSNQEVIKLAENHQLSSHPEYGEWLILLDRGDLIEG